MSHLLPHRDDDILYQGRWVPREHFRVFVYSHTDEKLVNTHEEFVNAIATGVWFEKPPEPVAAVEEKAKKKGDKGEA